MVGRLSKYCKCSLTESGTARFRWRLARFYIGTGLIIWRNLSHPLRTALNTRRHWRPQSRIPPVAPARRCGRCRGSMRRRLRTRTRLPTVREISDSHPQTVAMRNLEQAVPRSWASTTEESTQMRMGGPEELRHVFGTDTR